MKALLIVATLAACAISAFAAEVAPMADGSFTSRNFTMPVSTAMAFRGKSIIDKADVIFVAITNGDIRVDWFATFFDRRRAIEQRMKDKDTAVVYLEFKPDGAYRGLSYYFAKGNGCGYCGGSLGVTSTVKLANGRLAGSLKSKDESRAYDVTFNLPITADDHGAPLPANGGAPGKAYLGYHEALVKRDAKALRPFLSNEMRESLTEAEKKGKVAAELKYLAKEHPDKSVQITKGFSTDKQAVLLITGESSVIKLTGEVVLVNEGGTWRVDDELTEVVMQ
jgi:hypothetical protein